VYIIHDIQLDSKSNTNYTVIPMYSKFIETFIIMVSQIAAGQIVTETTSRGFFKQFGRPMIYLFTNSDVIAHL